MKPFCWWAIDLVTAKQFHLYRNGMSNLLEYNIHLECSNAVSGIYGFSFINITTDIPYIDVKVHGEQLRVEERQKILVEVIYYCCKSCELYENKTDEEIIEELATEFYKRRFPDRNDATTRISRNDLNYCINMDAEEELKTFGSAPCIFMLDVNTPSKVHVGEMHWNKIDLTKQSSERENNSLVALALRGHFCAKYSISQIPDGQCVRYASTREYFVLCCCYQKPELCAYASSTETISSVKENRQIWESDLTIRNPILANELHGKVHKASNIHWTYRDFLYSHRSTLPVSRNVPLWHCAVGQFMVYSAQNFTPPVELERLERQELPLRSQYCIADFWIEFKQGQTESVLLDAKEDSTGNCNSIESVFCQLVGPDCLNNLLHMPHIQGQYRCCCNSGNLCNHWGNNNPSKSNYQIGLKPEDFQKVVFQCHIKAVAYLTQIFMKGSRNDLSNKCWRSFDFQFEQEILMIDNVSYQQYMTYRVAYKEFPSQNLVCEILDVFPLRPQNCHRKDYVHQWITYQFFKCDCRRKLPYFDLLIGLFFNYQMENDINTTCDENMPQYFEKYKSSLIRPSCYEVYDEDGPFSMGIYSVRRNSNFTSSLVKKVVTNSTPICVTFVKVSREKISFGIYALRPARTETEAQNSKRFVMLESDQSVTFVQRCQSNLTKPCNDFNNLFQHFLPYSIHRYVRERMPSGYSKCFITDDLQRINCNTNLGCFDFHSPSGVRQRGCIDDIPRIIKKKPELTVLNYCKHAKLWQSRSYICNAIRNITHPHDESVSGVLCCCKRICPLSNQNQSPTNANMGFNIFESLS